MRLSVALCAFNGERFLPDQLDGIRTQSRPPDELVVCDDASADGTADIVRRFAATAPFPVRLVVNEATLGSTANFAAAIHLCTGDTIALADQDDIWLPHKLATMERALADAPAAGFAFSDAEVVDESLAPAGYGLWEAIRFGRREQVRFRRGGAFAGLLRRHRVTGATMAFRAEYRPLVLPIPPGWVHDAWIALLIAAVAPCVVVSERLIRYRQHAAQQHGGKKRGWREWLEAARRSDREKFAAVAARSTEARDRLQGVAGVPPDFSVRLEEKVRHSGERVAMREPGAWRLPRVLRELGRGRYHRYSRGWAAVAQDVFLG